MSQRTALHVSTPAATIVELPPELASFHAYCLHSSKQPEHHDLLMQISAEVADPSDRFSAFHETRLAWAKENLPLLLAKIDIGDDRLERMNGPATSLFLECRDLLERSSDSEDKGKITDAVSLLVRARLTSSPIRPSIESSKEMRPPAHLMNLFEFLSVTDSNFSKDSIAAHEQAQRKWISEEFIPWFANDSETQQQLKDLHKQDKSFTSLIFSLYGAKTPHSHSHFEKVVEFTFRISFPKPQPPPALHDDKKLSTAFHQDFLDPHGYIPRLRKDLDNAAKLWRSKKYYYPGVTLVQTSGSGKSRAVAQLASRISKDKDGLRVVYCSLMKPDSTGYPKRSKIADKLVSCLDEKVFKCYFAACFEKVMGDQLSEPREILELQTNDSTQEAFWNDVEKRMEMLKPLKDDDLKQRPLFVQSTRNNLEVVFVFDEARSLLEMPHNRSDGKSPFYYMRRAAQSFADHSRAFIISMDTTSRMSDLAPVNRFDPTERLAVPGEDQKKNFRPLFLFGSVDVGLFSSYGLKDTDAFSPRKYLSHGRILWRALIDASFTVEKVRELAVSKLAGGGRASYDSTPKITATMAASFIRARVPYLVYQPELASELVASNMWWCLSISEERDHMVAGMPSEPILSDAAALWMHNAENRAEILKLFAYLSSRSAIDVGHGGEIVAQLLLIFGRDAAVWKGCENFGEETKSILEKDRNPQVICPHIAYFGLIGLDEFLQSTLQESDVSIIREESNKRSNFMHLPDPMAVGKVSFTHFVRLFDIIRNMTELALLFARGAAVWCRVGTEGVDLIIPVLMPNRNNEYVVHADNMTYILVQVKNYADRGKDKDFPRSATTKNSALACDLDTVPRHQYLSLFLSFGGKTAEMDILEPHYELPDLMEKLPPSPTISSYVVPKDGPYSDTYSILCEQLCKEIAEEQRRKAKEAALKRAGKRKRDADVGADNAQVSNCISLTEAVRRFRQLSVAVLGFSQDLYPCISPATLSPEGSKGLSDEIFMHLKKLLRSPLNPIHRAADPKEVEILKRMVYPSSLDMLRESESAAFKSGAKGAPRDENFSGTISSDMV